jgi:hypothetical protein
LKNEININDQIKIEADRVANNRPVKETIALNA